MKKYLIDYENAHWCGGQLHVVVNARNDREAVEKAEYHMEECQRELFYDEYNEKDQEYENYDDESAVTINSVTVLDENNEYWEFYRDPNQAEFYPELT